MEQMRNEINELIEQSKQKAKVLTEALPYIRRFNNCYVVVKYGGSAMKDKNLQKSVIRDVALLKLVGMKPIKRQWKLLKWYYLKSIRNWWP